MKEWLCLTCQVQRALKDAKPPEVAATKTPVFSNALKKDTTSPAEPEHKVSPAPQSPQKMLPAKAEPGKTEAVAKPDGEKQPSSTAPPQKKPQEAQKTNPKDGSDPKAQAGRKESVASSAATAAAAQPVSGGLFGFGGSKTPTPSAEKSESVTGKMFGFGSSVFGSASALITSAVQDQPRTTPPASPRMSPAKEINKPPAAQRAQPPPQTRRAPTAEDKVEKAPSGPPDAAASRAAVKPDTASCPLCKAELNVGAKSPSNYSTCTSCKSVVCNQCGFNPMPNESNVSRILAKRGLNNDSAIIYNMLFCTQFEYFMSASLKQCV